MSNTDSSQVEKLLNDISNEKRHKILFQALKDGAKVLKQQTQQQIASKYFKSNTPNRWNGKTMAQGVNMKCDSGTSEVTVSIMGDFRLKFFEKGTKNRHTKSYSTYLSNHSLMKNGKGRNVGHISPTHFFKEARENEEPIQSAIKKSLDNSFNQLSK